MLIRARLGMARCFHRLGMSREERDSIRNDSRFLDLSDALERIPPLP